MDNIKFTSLILPLLFCAIFSQKSNAEVDCFRHPAYVGFGTGYGSTTWGGLVPRKKNLNSALAMSTPIHSREGGIIYSFFAGYELSPYFAFESNFIQFPNATVTFAEDSLFRFNTGKTVMISNTNMVNLIAKIMLIIPDTRVRVFSSIGVAAVHRDDFVYDHWHASPTFGTGFNTVVTPHILTEVGANFTAGSGEAQLSPSESYIPFLYSIMARIAYRF